MTATELITDNIRKSLGSQAGIMWRLSYGNGGYAVKCSRSLMVPAAKDGLGVQGRK